VSLEVAFAIFLMAVCLFCSPLVSARLRIPAAVIEILLGIAVTALLGPIDKEGFIRSIGQMGLGLLVFGAGADVDLRRAAAAGPRTLFFVALALAGNFGASAVVGAIFGVSPLFYLLGPAIAIALAAAVLRELDLIRAPVGQMTLILGGPGLILSVALLAV
jgi:Kef-type K+ transport system membrane component KefB